MIEPRLGVGATKGLDWRADYHIIKNSFKAAAAGSGAAGKTLGSGGSGANFSEKTLTISARPHTLIKLKFGQFWPRHTGRDAGVAQW